MNNPARSPGRNFLIKIASLSQHIGQNGIIFWSCMCFLFRSMRISFIIKVTRLNKAVTVANNTSLCSTILVVFLELIHFGRPGWNFPYEHTTELVPVTEPARLPAHMKRPWVTNMINGVIIIYDNESNYFPFVRLEKMVFPKEVRWRIEATFFMGNCIRCVSLLSCGTLHVSYSAL